MIQRIQSLYLLAVVVLMTFTLFAPIAVFTVGDIDFTLTAFSLSGGGESQTTLWMGIMLVLSTLLPFVTIFLFKRRTLQIRLCAVEIILLLGSLVFIGRYYWLTTRIFEGFSLEHRQFGWAAPMPIISLVLSYLASRAIFKDEVLVRSLDRIR